MKLCTLALFGLVLAGSAPSQVTTYFYDRAAFTAAGGAPVACDFDGLGDNTPFEGGKVAGATFHGLGSPLLVVNGTETYTPGEIGGTHRLLPTSGTKVLSPGGKELGFGTDVQLDSIEITFDAPTRSFGFDLLYQSDDFAPYTAIELYDASNALLYSSDLPTSSTAGAGAPGGAEFYGFVAPRGIGRVVVRDNDNDATNPDANIGYDTLRYAAVPEPATAAGLGLGALALLRGRRRSAG